MGLSVVYCSFSLVNFFHTRLHDSRWIEIWESFQNGNTKILVGGQVVGPPCMDTVKPTHFRQVTKNLSCVHDSVKSD